MMPEKETGGCGMNQYHPKQVESNSKELIQHNEKGLVYKLNLGWSVKLSEPQSFHHKIGVPGSFLAHCESSLQSLSC